MLDFIRPQKHFPLAVTRHALRGGAALRVAHLTDLHLEDGADAAWLRRLVRVVNAQRRISSASQAILLPAARGLPQRRSIAKYCAGFAPGTESLPSPATTIFWARREGRRSSSAARGSLFCKTRQPVL